MRRYSITRNTQDWNRILADIEALQGKHPGSLALQQFKADIRGMMLYDNRHVIKGGYELPEAVRPVHDV